MDYETQKQSGIQDIVYGVHQNAPRRPVGEEEQYVFGLLGITNGAYSRNQISRMMSRDNSRYTREDRRKIQNVISSIAAEMHGKRADCIILQSIRAQA